MNTKAFTDEELMAYADGQLEESSAAAIRQACSVDVQVAARVEMFRASNRLLRRAFEPLAHEAVPQHLLNAVEALGDETAPAAPLPQPRPATAVHRRRLRIPAALAASIAGVLAFACGWSLHQPSSASAGSSTLIALAAELPAGVSSALDHTASGDIAHARLGTRTVDVLALASYENGGGYCREFEVTATQPGSPSSVRGVACRDNGGWVTRVVASRNSSAASGDDYQPASGDRELMPLLGSSRALSEQEERELLKRGWQKP